MPIEVIDKIKQKNGGTFKLMDAKDIAIDDTNIEDYTKKIKEESAKNNKELLKKIDSDNVYNKKQVDEKIWTMNNMGDDVKKAMTGGSVAVVGEDVVNTINLRDGAVNEYKTNFLENTKNLFNKRTVSTKGYWKSTTTGNSETNEYTTDLCYSDFIPVSSSTYYVSAPSITHSYCQYDSNKAFIKGDRYSSAFETAENAAYIVLNVEFKNTSKIQFEKGKENTLYEDYMLDFPLLRTNKTLNDYIRDNNKTINDIIQKTIALDNTFNFDTKNKIINYPNSDGIGQYEYTTSTFSGWGTEIGRHQFVKSIKFKVKARDIAVTKLKISLFYDGIDGTKIYDELRDVNIQPHNETEVIVNFNDTIVNYNKRFLYLVYQANQLIDMYGADSLLGADVKPNFYYWVNGNLEFNPKFQVSERGSFATQVEILSETGDYDIRKGIIKYTDVLNKDALEDTFVLSNHFNKNYENGQREFEEYDWSTFSGWGSYLGNCKNIKVLKFKVKNRDSKNTTKVKCWITKFNKDGEVLVEKTFMVNIKQNETETITWTFDTPFNAKGENLYLCYATNTLTTMIATTMPFVADNVKCGHLSYITNTDLNSVSPDVFMEVTDSPKAVRVEVGEMKPTLDPTPTFIEKVMADNSDSIPSDSVRVILPDKITAVVGDTLQLFYRGLVEAVNPYNYDIRVRCVKGKAFTRYFEFTPLAEDVGEYDFTIDVYNNAKILLAKAQCKLEVVNTTGTVSTQQNILCVGDSLTAGGVWCRETMRRLVESDGDPVGLNKTNINFIGTQKNQNCLFEGYGGWVWGSYLLRPNTLKEDIWIYCTHDKTSRDQHSIWKDSNGSKWKLETIERDRLKFTRFESHTNPPPTAPGTLTHVQNAVNTNSINFNQCIVASGSPFWDLKSDRVDFKKYCEVHGFDKIDYVYTLLTWNSGVADKATIEDNETVIDQAKQFIDILHRDYPNAKVRIMGIPLPSLNGGTGESYGANGGYADRYGLVRGVFGLNLAYQEFANREEYKDFVEFINVSGQFDSENNMQDELVKVNTRSNKTELRGTNGVHPATEGYYQIADVSYRQLVRDLLQN